MTIDWLYNMALVGTGGMIGAFTRHRLSTYVSKRFPSSIPYGTLSVNLIGCFLLGCVMGRQPFDNWKLLLGTGFMGAFTTFSTLKLESIKLLQGKEVRSWLLYSAITYMLGILLVFLGYYL